MRRIAVGCLCALLLVNFSTPFVADAYAAKKKVARKTVKKKGKQKQANVPGKPDLVVTNIRIIDAQRSSIIREVESGNQARLMFDVKNKGGRSRSRVSGKNHCSRRHQRPSGFLQCTRIGSGPQKAVLLYFHGQ